MDCKILAQIGKDYSIFSLLSEKKLIVLCVAITETRKITPYNKAAEHFPAPSVKMFSF